MPGSFFGQADGVSSTAVRALRRRPAVVHSLILPREGLGRVDGQAIPRF